MRIIVVLALLGAAWSATFNPSATSVTPSYAKSQASTYSFSLSATSAFVQNFDLIISFPSQFSLVAPSNCGFWVNTVQKASANCSLDGQNIKFTNLLITESISSIRVQFNSSTANYAATATLTFSYYDPSTAAALSLVNYISLTITNAVMSCSLSSSSAIVGDNATYTLTYTPIVSIESGSILQINLQPWGAYSASNFVTTSTGAICGGACSLTIPSSNNNISETVRYTSLFSANTSSQGSLQLLKAKNPPSQQPITFSVSLMVTVSSTDRTYMTCSSTFSVPTPNSFSVLTFPTTNSAIGASNVITLRLTPKNPISSATYLRINPGGLTISYTYNLYNQATRPSQTTTTDGTLLLGNLTASTTTPPISLTLNNFTLVNPPYSSKAVTLTFTTFNLISTTEYQIEQGTVDVVATPSAITSAGLSMNPTTLNSLANYTIWFVAVNALASTSFIVLTMPSEINLGSAACSASPQNSACSVPNSTSLKVQLGASLAAGSNVTVTLTNAKNPPTTTSTSAAVSISTYYQDASSLVDSLPSSNSLLKVTATSTVFKSVSLSASGTQVGAVANYTLTVQINNELPSGSVMKIKIPTTSFPSSTVSLQKLSWGGSSVAACTLSTISTMYYQLDSSCFPTAVPASSQIQVVLNSLTNPLSTKQTDSWEVETLFNSKQMEYLLQGITTKMTIPAALTYSIATPTSDIANSVTDYQFEFTFLLSHYSGDRVIITFPDGVLLGGSFSCTAVTTGVTMSCSQTNSVTLEAAFTFSSASTISALKFKVSSITNNWYASVRTFSFQTTTNDSTYYFVQSGSTAVNYQAATMGATSASNEQIVLLSTSTIQLTFKSPFVLSRATDQSLLKLTVDVPADLTPIDNSCVLSISGSACSLAGQKFTISSFNDFSSELILTFTATATYFTQTSAFTTKLTYNGSNVATDLLMKVTSYCTSPCQQCTSTRTSCITCLPSPYSSNNTYMPDNSTCVVDCPTAYFRLESAGECRKCNTTACAECEISANTCTSCASNKYLHESTCLSACPEFYYSFNGECLQCSSPCLACSSSSVCLSCVSNYFLDLDNSCVLTCSNTSYLGVDGLCKMCTNNCLSCAGTLSNCTSCEESQYLLFNNSCVRACQSGFYNNVNSTCEACISPCATCSSATICNSCVSSYYLYKNATCTQNCPPGTIAVINQCQSCQPECATCSVLVNNCTSCSASLLFYQNQCLTDCPPLMYPYNKTCTYCISPCVTCASSPDLCTSCTDGLFLLANSCVSVCPSSGYYTEGSVCMPCVDNCLTCTSVSKCSVCAANYYLLSGACVSSCPSSNPIIENRECKDCDVQCATCSGSPDNCTQCTVFYFKYEYTCVEECPLTFYSNVNTYTCEDGLTSKIVFFPILITAFIVLIIVIVSKCFAPSTSIPTAYAALLSPLELAIWIYVLVLLSDRIKEPDVNYSIPIGLLVIAVVCFFITSGVFFFFNRKRQLLDETAVQWSNNNVNYAVLWIVQICSLPLGLKFYRIIYSRLFNSLPLSMAYKNRSNVFTIAVIFTILQLVMCEILAIAGLWFLVYNKNLKDQIFYSSVEGLIVTVLAAIISLIDIYKPDDYFEESDFQKMKKYVEKVKDSSFNKLEEGFDISQEEGSMDGERFVSMTGGKFMYSKRDPDKLFFEDSESKSEITDALETTEKRKSRRVNIFQPIKEEEAEYYEGVKFPEEEYHTAAEDQRQRKNMKAIPLEYDQEGDIYSQNARRSELGVDEDESFDDQKSLLGERARKKKWNSLIDDRKKKADKIFNKHPYDLAKIEEPLMQDEEDHDEPEEDAQGEQGQGHYRPRRRRRRRGDRKGGKRELEQIYLQRLTEKKKKASKDGLFSDKAIKYDF